MVLMIMCILLSGGGEIGHWVAHCNALVLFITHLFSVPARPCNNHTYNSLFILRHVLIDPLQQECMSTVQIVLNIFSNASGTVDPVLRDFAGVLLRRAVEKSQFSAELNAELRGILLGLWKSETNSGLLKRLAHVMAQSAMNSSWIELLPQIVGNVSAQLSAGTASDAVVPPALLLVEVVAEYCPQDILTHMQILGGFLSSQLGSHTPAIQVSCAKCTGACIVALEDDTAREAFKPAIQPIISILGAALSRGDETDASAITEYLVVIAQVQVCVYVYICCVLKGLYL